MEYLHFLLLPGYLIIADLTQPQNYMWTVQITWVLIVSLNILQYKCSPSSGMFITILKKDFNGGKFRPRSEHLLPFLEFSTGHSLTESRWRRESWRNPAGSRPLGFIINHSTGHNNRTLLMRLTIQPWCLSCHASWFDFIQLSISQRSNQHFNIQS